MRASPFRRRRGPPASLREPYRRFAEAAAVLERGKEELLRAIPGARTPGVPLAEALLAFREAVGEAEALHPGWRLPAVEDEWRACGAGLARAFELEERLRTSGGPLAHDALLAALGDLIAPLEPFAEAARAFRALW